MQQINPSQSVLSTVSDPLLTETQIEKQTGGVLKAVSLRNWRSQDKHQKELPCVRIGSRVYYRRSVIERFLTPKESAPEVSA